MRNEKGDDTREASDSNDLPCSQDQGKGAMGLLSVDPDAPGRPLLLWKRGFDLAFVFLTLPCWLPLMLVLALGIKIIDSGPLLFRQERVGYRGRIFSCLKFRSMKVNVETRSHEDLLTRIIETDCPMTKLDAAGDPRLIPFGRLFRASGLDELPQIFNIIRGEMSIVGPRPCTPFEFSKLTPAQRQRVNAAPGVTGFWQVNGKNKTTFARMIALDLFYISHQSLWLDLKIIALTIPTLFSQLFETWNFKSPASQRSTDKNRLGNN